MVVSVAVSVFVTEAVKVIVGVDVSLCVAERSNVAVVVFVGVFVGSLVLVALGVLLDVSEAVGLNVLVSVSVGLSENVAVIGGGVLLGISVGVTGIPGGRVFDKRVIPIIAKSATQASAMIDAQPRLPRLERLLSDAKRCPGWLAAIMRHPCPFCQ